MIDYSNYPQWEQILYKEAVAKRVEEALKRANEKLVEAGLEEAPSSDFSIFKTLFVTAGFILAAYGLYYCYQNWDEKKEKNN